MRDMGGFLCEVISGLQISAEEADLAVYILFEKQRSIWPGESAMNCDGRCAGNGCDLAGPLAARFKASNGAMNHPEVRDSHGVAVAFPLGRRRTVAQTGISKYLGFETSSWLLLLVG